MQLRTYVKSGQGKEQKRGVLLLGNLASEELSHSIHFEEGGVDTYGRPYSNGVVEYKWNGGRLQLKTSGLPQPSSFSPQEHSIAQRGWWYESTKLGVMEFSMKHPDWFYWEAQTAEASVDLEKLKRREWEPILSGTPTLAFLAKGSPIVFGFPRRR